MPTKLSTVSVARTPLLEEYNSWYSPTGLCVPTVAQCAVSPAARAISAENSPNNNTGVFISCKMTGKIRATCAHSERGLAHRVGRKLSESALCNPALLRTA